MQKLIRDNRKISLLVVIIMVFVSVAAFSNVAQAPESNLAAVDSVNVTSGRDADTPRIEPLDVRFFPVLNPAARPGSILVFPKYKVTIKNKTGDASISEFEVNIETKVSTPKYSSVTWSGISNEIVTLSINDNQVLNLLQPDSQYSAYISAINTYTGVAGESLINEFITSPIVTISPTVVEVSQTNNVVAERRGLLGEAFQKIGDFLTGIVDFLTSLFGGGPSSSSKYNSGGLKK